MFQSLFFKTLRRISIFLHQIRSNGVSVDYFKILPMEITVDILSRLPTESILNCKLVCTNWNNLVSQDPLFTEMHFHRINHPSNASDSGKFGFLALAHEMDNMNQIFWYCEYDETTNLRIRKVNFTPPFHDFRFVGSCNGLICLASGRSVCIINPITKEYVMIPELKRNSDIDGYSCSFGYVSSTNDYKVVEIFKLENQCVEVHIYTLGSGHGWRNLGEFNVGFILDLEENVIFANEALYWLDHCLDMIITFDLAEEKFCEHISPPPVPTDRRWMWNLDKIGVLDGFLFFASGQNIGEAESYEIWLLKTFNGNHVTKGRNDHQSLIWSKEFRVKEYHIDLLAIMRSGGVLTYADNHLNIYDKKTSTSKRLVKFKNKLLQVFPHKNTMVSLKILGKEDIKTMESVQIKGTRSHDYPFNNLQEIADPEYIHL